MATYQFASTVITLATDAVIEWNLNVSIVDQHDAFVATIVARTLTTHSSQPNQAEEVEKNLQMEEEERACELLLSGYQYKKVLSRKNMWRQDIVFRKACMQKC